MPAVPPPSPSKPPLPKHAIDEDARGQHVRPRRAFPRLLLALADVSRSDPAGRKLLLCAAPAHGRELLRAAAVHGVDWLGWEVLSLRQLAFDLLAPELARDGERIADDFDLLALRDEAIDEVVERGRGGPFAERGVGPYREAIHRSLDALRMGGIPSDRLAGSGVPRLRALGRMLRAFESGLRRGRLADEPALLRRAADALEEERARLPPEASLHLLPGLSRRGVPGLLLRALEARGAALLDEDAPEGLAAPPGLLAGAPASAASGPLGALHRAGDAGAPASDTASGAAPDLFAAATPMDEIREVLRRVAARRIPWDRVEIVAVDPAPYAAALDAVSSTLSIPATFGRGLDSRRTRVGRAVHGYFRWIGDDLPEDVLRGLLEAGDLSPEARAPGGAGSSTPSDAAPRDSGAGGFVAGASLARRLRRLRVGWGRARYLEGIERALRGARERPRTAEGEEPDELAADREREIRELTALRDLLRRLLHRIPPVPERGGASTVSTSPAALADGLAAFLELVPPGDRVENTVRREIERRLERIRATLTRPTSWEAAVGLLERHLRPAFAPEGSGGGTPSWISTGGRIHLSDIESGGLAARPHTFVVGLAAGAVSSSATPDPLLNDRDRTRLNGGAHPTPLALSGERAEEARFRIARLLARLRGEVTLSYSAWDRLEGRAVAPAPELLLALRLARGNAMLGFEDLRRELGSLASALPGEGGRIDAADVWLGALDGGGVLRRGQRQVREAFPGIDRGLQAEEARRSGEVGRFDGLLPAGSYPPRDPSGAPARASAFSATRLEALGTCPRRYFYRYLLGVRPPDELSWDPERWLDSGDRGSLLHRVFERALAGSREKGIAPEERAFEALALEVLEEEAERLLDRVPPPGASVHRTELAALRADVLSFVRMIRDRCPSWLHTELVFGPDGASVELDTPLGPVQLRGAIDRIDEAGPGLLRVVDYKTGRPGRYRPTVPFQGGRRIQHVLYTHAAAHLLEGQVEAMEYHFPTRRGENQVVAYPQATLAPGRRAIELLFGILGDGHFMTTEDVSDCTWCDFTAICRAEADEHGTLRCERVRRMKEGGIELPANARLRALRALDAGGS